MLSASLALALGDLSPSSLRVNYLAAPDSARFPSLLLGVDGSAAPDFSWQLTSTTRGAAQAAYSLQVATDAAFASVVCDSGRVASNATLCVQPCGAADIARVAPGASLYWRVAVAESAGGALSAPVSGPSFLRGPTAADFVAGFVSPPPAAGFGPFRLRAVAPPPPPGHAVLRATAFVCTPAYFQLWSGGARVDAGREYGYWPEFNGRVFYEALDLTGLFLAPGAAGAGVALGVRLGPGTYGYGQFARTYGATALPLLFELHVDVAGADGAPRRLVYASRPRVGAGAAVTPLDFHFHGDTTVNVDWYGGEDVDNTLSAALEGWDSPTFVEGGAWNATEPYAGLAGRALTPPPLPPVTRALTLAPVQMWAFNATSTSTFTFAFAQNFAGRVEVDVPAAGFANTTIGVYAGEETDGKGGVRNQLRCNMAMSWKLRGLANETVTLTWMFWGAQYFGVKDWPNSMPPPTLASVRGVATSTFTDEMVALRLSFDGVAPSADIANGFVAPGTLPPAAQPPRAPDASAAALWASPPLNSSILAGVQHLTLQCARANFQSIPSDCPNREKRGWMGDGQVSSWQLVTNFDAAGAYRSWLQGMADDQAHNAVRYPTTVGGISSPMVPIGDWPPLSSDAAWGVAVGEVTMQQLKQYGDATFAARLYPNMRAYYLFLRNQTDPKAGIMTSVAQWGDWDAAFPRSVYQPNTCRIGATASHLRLAQYLLEIADLAGRGGDKGEYEGFLAQQAPLFNAYYQNATAPWTYVDGVEQTPTLLPLALGIVPAGVLDQAVAWLVNDVETTRAVHLSTGATGTRLFFEFLSSVGRTDLAAAVAAQDSFPSHGYWVTQGATTAWENWSGLPDAQHGNAQPTHDHIFLASHSGWILSRLVGLAQPAGSYGYARVAVAPPLIDSLPSMAGELASVRGRIAVSWAWVGGAPMSPGAAMALNVSIPANVAASISVVVAGLAGAVVRESGTVVWQNGAFVPGAVAGLTSAALDGAFVTFQAGSGDYQFSPSAGSPASAAAAMAPSACFQAQLPTPSALTCAAGSRIAAIVRAGLRAPRGAALSRRFLVAHALEARCLGKAACALPSAAELADALAPAVSLLDEERGADVCARALCA